MAAAANQQIQNQLDQTSATARNPLSPPTDYLISGIPSIDWYRRQTVVDDLLSKKRVGGTLDAIRVLHKEQQQAIHMLVEQPQQLGF